MCLRFCVCCHCGQQWGCETGGGRCLFCIHLFRVKCCDLTSKCMEMECQYIFMLLARAHSRTHASNNITRACWIAVRCAQTCYFNIVVNTCAGGMWGGGLWAVALFGAKAIQLLVKTAIPMCECFGRICMGCLSKRMAAVECPPNACIWNYDKRMHTHTHTLFMRFAPLLLLCGRVYMRRVCVPATKTARTIAFGKFHTQPIINRACGRTNRLCVCVGVRGESARFYTCGFIAVS